MGAFTFKPGGRIKLDVIRDFKPIGNEDAFDTRTIPVDGSEGTNSNLIAKESRLSLDIRGPVEGRELRMYIETDFYGTSSALRLRHAYGSYGGLLAGQTWSTFVDEDNMPRTIDFESPTAFASIRQAQVRFTTKLTDSVTWSAAVEDNKSNITIPTNVPGKAEYMMPDLVTRFRWDVPDGHMTTALFLGAARFRPTGEDPDTVTLWGGVLGAKFNVMEKDSIYGVFTFGEGIGRYRGGTTAVPDETGALHAVGGLALMGGYEHFWHERWSTNATYSIADTNAEDFYTSDINSQLNYFAINLLYWFLGDRAWTGVEYLYGGREVFGQGNATGAAHRIQYAVRFNLP
jgi:DcaP outer membrane protein